MTSRLEANLGILSDINPQELSEDARGRLAMLAVTGFRLASERGLPALATGYRDLASRVDSTFDIAVATGQVK